MPRPKILALGKVFLLAMPLIVISATVSADEFKPIPAGDSHIKFLSKHFAGTTPKTFRRDTRNGFQEYSTYSKGQTRAEIFHIRTTPNRYFRTLETPKENITTWSYFNDKEITWDVSGTKGGTSIGLIRFQKFLLGSEKRKCVSFTSAWGTSQGGRAGKTRKMEGYFCKPIGESLSAEEILSLTGDIRITEQVQSSAVDLRNMTGGHPFDGTWRGKAVIMNQWCGSGPKRFSLNLTVENGRIRGGDSDGAYAADGQVSADGGLIGTSLNNRLLMEGSITEGKIRLANYDCSGRYALQKAAVGSSTIETSSLTQGTAIQSPKSQMTPAPEPKQQAALPESHQEPHGAPKSIDNDAPTNQFESSGAKATLEPAGHFDGEWVLEIREPAQMPTGDKVSVDVVDGQFTANVSANGWRGTVSGEIDRYGILVATGSLRRPSRPSALLKWSSEPSGDRYIAKVPATTLWLAMTFEVSLSRAAMSSDDGSSKGPTYGEVE
jgi:hypothetical protein